MRILDELGTELERATRAAEQSRGAGAARSARQVVAIVIAGLLAATGVALAAKAVIERGDPLPPPAAADVPAELTPRPGTTTLNRLDVPDPDGGPVWDVRTARSRSGAICASVGQVLDGELGIVGLDRTFRALSPGAADTCSVAQPVFTLAGARGFRGRNGTPGITVVSGVGGRAVQSLSVAGGGRAARELTLGRDRAFLAIFNGQPEAVRPRLVATLGDGRTRTLHFADTGEVLAPDPTGGTPWKLDVVPARQPGLRCVRAQRLRGPDSPPPTPVPIPGVPEVPIRCGPRDGAFVAIRRFVPAAPRVGTFEFWWGAHPSRTIVWGGAGRARRVTLHGARERVTVDRRTGAFLAVLDGKVDPRRLSVTIGGRTLRGATTVGRRGQRLRPLPVPPWRSVATALRDMPKSGFVAIPGTLRDGGRATDPSGGPDWGLRTWRARIPRDARVSPGMGRDMRCFAVGQVGRDGRLHEPLPAGRSRVVGTTGQDAYCNPTTDLRRRAGGVDPIVYVDDPYAPDPKPVRVVVAGLLGAHVRSAEVLGAGAPRPLKLGRYGSFLLMLEPRDAERTLRIRQVGADGTRATSRGFSPLQTCRADAQQARVADPDGGPSWVAGVSTGKLRVPTPPGVGDPRTRMQAGVCRYVGQLVGGRVASLLDDTLRVYYAPMTGSFGGTGADFLSRRHPLIVDVQGPGDGYNRRSTAPLNSAQVARRTLAGRTLVHGIAHRDVVAITLRTPRDVRTIRPQRPGGAYLAVYDGPFYGGEIVATARLRDGKTVTQRRPLGRH